MTPQAERYPFVTTDPAREAASLFPYLPLTVAYRQRSLSIMGLLDTAAAVNVLPFQIGEQLGAIWEDQTTKVPLTGNLAQQEARALLLTATIGKFPPVPLAFAWTRSDDCPVLLGQVNFL